MPGASTEYIQDTTIAAQPTTLLQPQPDESYPSGNVEASDSVVTEGDDSIQENSMYYQYICDIRSLHFKRLLLLHRHKCYRLQRKVSNQ